MPLYNAEAFLSEAVESVLREREKGLLEIIFVEDASPDNSLALAREFQSRYPDIIRLYQHPDGKNHGAGASRNLGINNATGDLICFLDADDFWLPGRLDGAQELLTEDDSLDGVYDPTTYQLETEEERQQFANEMNNPDTRPAPPPDELFETHFEGRAGLWHTNGIVCRRRVFDKVGLFNENLRKRQDGQLWLRMITMCRFAKSPLNKPVAAYRRHGANRWNPQDRKTNPKEVFASEAKLWESLYEWIVERKSDIIQSRIDLFIKQIMIRLGRARAMKTAWSVAMKENNPFLIVHAIRGFLPGPRRIKMWLKEKF